MLRNVPRALACLLLAGTSVALASTAAAQSTPPAAGTQQQQQQPAGGGLILPGSVQPSQSGAAAGTIQQPSAAGQPRPAAPAAAQQPRPQQAAPAQGAAQPGAQAQQQAKPPAPGKPAALVGAWDIGPQVFSDGSFRLCVAEAKFDNNLVLGLLRNPAKRVNMIVGVPGGNLPAGARFDARVKIDGKVDKQIPAVVTNPEIVTVNIAADESIPAALSSGSVLTIEVPGEALAFQLKGTTKALNDLSTCVDQAAAGKLQLPSPPPMMPPQLAQLLVEAGLKDAQALPVDKMPPERRPGEFAWRIGENILGAVERFPVDPKSPGVAKVGEDYLGALGKACGGTFTPTNGAVDKLPSGEMMISNATCQNKDGTFYLSIAFQLLTPPQGAPEGAAKLLNVFSHRGAPEGKAAMDNATAGIAKALKQRATQPAPAAPAGQGQQQPKPQGQPKP